MSNPDSMGGLRLNEQAVILRQRCVELSGKIALLTADRDSWKQRYEVASTALATATAELQAESQRADSNYQSHQRVCHKWEDTCADLKARTDELTVRTKEQDELKEHKAALWQSLQMIGDALLPNCTRNEKDAEVDFGAMGAIQIITRLREERDGLAAVLKFLQGEGITIPKSASTILAARDARVKAEGYQQASAVIGEACVMAKAEGRLEMWKEIRDVLSTWNEKAPNRFSRADLRTWARLTKPIVEQFDRVVPQAETSSSNNSNGSTALGLREAARIAWYQAKYADVGTREGWLACAALLEKEAEKADREVHD